MQFKPLTPLPSIQGAGRIAVAPPVFRSAVRNRFERGNLPMSRPAREAELIRLWLQRPDGRRNTDDVLAFYSEIERNRPDLVPRMRGRGDPHQRMKSILRAYIEGAHRPPPMQ